MFLEFGFIQREFAAVERGPSYEVAVGFLSGTLLGAFALSIAFNPGTAGISTLLSLGFMQLKDA